MEEQAIKGGKKNSKKALTNDDITASEVRLVGAAGEQVGIVSLQEARDAATAAGLDLVQMVADTDPLKLLSLKFYQAKTFPNKISYLKLIAKNKYKLSPL